MPKLATPAPESKAVSLRISVPTYNAIVQVKKEYGGSITSICEEIIEGFRHIPARQFRRALADLERMGNAAVPTRADTPEEAQ